jgi:hypothetical protein
MDEDTTIAITMPKSSWQAHQTDHGDSAGFCGWRSTVPTRRDGEHALHSDSNAQPAIAEFSRVPELLVLVLLLLLLLLLKRRLLWMVLYCTHRHLPGKAIQLSEVAASCAMTSCFCVACRFLLKDGFRIMFDLLYTASERVAKKAGFCVDCWLRRLSATPLRFFPYHGVFSL